jgi:DNA-binding transcriptional regulator YiaG
MKPRSQLPAKDSPNGSGRVVSITGRAKYRPEYKRLACALVAAAREKLGMSHAEFAIYLDKLLGWKVMPEAAARWEDESVPPGDVLLACAVITQDTPGQVLAFPLTATPERAAALLSEAGPAPGQPGSQTEAVLPYADRGLISRQQWNDIIRGSVSCLWLYGMAEFGYATDDEVPGILADAAASGCQVRVLLLDPGYAGTAAIDDEEGSPPGTLAARITASLARFIQMRNAAGPNMQVRTYNLHPTVSVVRGDDRMFATPYLRFSMGSNSPTFELTGGSASRMFDRYARHFDQTWNLSKDWT